jgi:hypothetical protein
MAQASTRSVGMDVHKDSLAVASMAPEPGAAVVALGPIGIWQCASEQLMRQLQSTSKPLVRVSAAGPCGSWLARSLTTKGDGAWGVAPARSPQRAGDRGTTDRRDAIQRAQRRRSGALTPVSGPAVAEAALCDLRRARVQIRSAT